MSRIAVIGAGFSGAVIARELVANGHYVEVFDQSNHVAGNCYTARDAATGVMVHKYGPHIFHTDNERVWRYIRRYGEMVPYIHRNKATAHGRVYSLPMNLHTINQFFGMAMSPPAAQCWLADVVKPNDNPRTVEELGLATIGRELYEAFFAGYTRKQWGRDPSELPASVMKRLPVRLNYDDNYFSHPYQAIPRHGYTDIVSAILDIPQCQVHLDAPFKAARAHAFDHTFYSGPLDAWFDHCFGRLAYRTLDFREERWPGPDYQGCPTMNYCDVEVPWTRVTEHKHFAPWNTETRGTVVYREFSREAGPGDILYYPVRLADDKAILGQYETLAKAQEHVTFVGRLGTYRYLDMDATIAEALAAVDRFLGFV